jgi:hypothetical protein
MDQKKEQDQQQSAPEAAVEAPPMRDPEPKAKEVSVEPTAHLGFKSVDGRSVLHQRVIVHREDGSAEPEWRVVPSIS